MTTAAGRDVTLDDRYLKESVYLSGLQALVRLLVEQNRRDRRAGLSTTTFISGTQMLDNYPHSRNGESVD